MVSETIDAPVETQEVDQAVPVEVAESPAPVEGVEAAAPDPEPAATELQVEVEAPPPVPLTLEQLEERDRKRDAEISAKAAADALEADRRRRQTEGARKAKAEADERESLEEAVDIVRVATADPEYNPLDPSPQVIKAIDRLAKKKADRLSANSADLVDQAFGYIVAPITGEDVEFDESFRPIGQKLAPKVQSFIEKMRPIIAKDAVDEYIKNEQPKAVEAEIARRAAKSREGQTELQRPEGVPSTSSVMSWGAYMALSEAEQLAMPEKERNAIMAADRKARLG